MSNDTYNEQFKQSTIKIMLDNLDDLYTWDSYNGDILQADLEQIKEILENLL